MHNELLRYLDAMLASREKRLTSVTASILRVLWDVVFIGAFLMIAFLWMLTWSSCRSSFWAGPPRFPGDHDIPDLDESSAEGRRSASPRTRSNRSMTW
jgi:hypothetical protein